MQLEIEKADCDSEYITFSSNGKKLLPTVAGRSGNQPLGTIVVVVMSAWQIAFDRL